MSKDKRCLSLGDSVMCIVSVLLLIGLLLVASACDGLDTGAAGTTASGGTDSTLTAGDSNGDSGDADDTTTISTTLASDVPGPTSTAVIQASPYVSLERMSPQVSIDPSMLLLWTRYEDDHPNILWGTTSNWQAVSSSIASGGTYKYMIAEPGGVTIRFWGTRIRLIAYTGPEYGAGTITVAHLSTEDDEDSGINVQNYDVTCYSETPGSQVIWTSPTYDYDMHIVNYQDFDLYHGVHDPNPITLDAVDMIGTIWTP